jgi:hypothetical protein
MRFLTTSLLGAALCLLMTSTSNAEFVFSFGETAPESSMASASSGLGTTYTTKVFVENTGPDDLLNFYGLTLVSDGGNPGITLAEPVIMFSGGGPFPLGDAIPFPSEATLEIGSFEFAVSGEATVGASSTFSGVMNSQMFTDPFVIAAEPMSFTLTAVPEPSSLLMFGSVLAFGMIRRRQA